VFNRPWNELGLDGVRLHDLRHDDAILLLATGTDIRTVSGRLGRADASTTLDICDDFASTPTSRRLRQSAPRSTFARHHEIGGDHRCPKAG
jgi:site-specific recombinase XerD